jgi:hypothetical protein
MGADGLVPSRISIDNALFSVDPGVGRRRVTYVLNTDHRLVAAWAAISAIRLPINKADIRKDDMLRPACDRLSWPERTAARRGPPQHRRTMLGCADQSVAEHEEVRAWLERFEGIGDVAFAFEACTRWRYVAGELAAGGDRGAPG